MRADDFECRLGRVHNYRTTAHVANRIDHERQAGEMVQVRMRNEDVIDLGEFSKRQIADAGSGVDQNVVVNQQ